MIRPSPELIAITRRWSEAIMRKDERTLKNLLSSSEHLCYQGTAAGERWSGSVLRDGFGDHVKEIPDFVQQEHHVEAFECGDVGWSIWTAELTFFSMAQPAVIRTSLVFAMEDGHWKIVQHHASNPSSNIEVIGVEHKALDALITAARDGFRQNRQEGTVTVMFTDIANSSAIAETLGDRIWAEAVQAHLAAVGAVITDSGGRLIKSLGDGTMSTFASARKALSAARAIQRAAITSDHGPPLELRIGLHTGDVIQTADDFFGTVVNKAARIATIAKPGDIQVSDATRIMVGSARDFDFSDSQTVRLKGLEGDHPIYRLDW